MIKPVLAATEINCPTVLIPDVILHSLDNNRVFAPSEITSEITLQEV